MLFWTWEISDDSPKIQKACSSELSPLGLVKDPPFAVFSGRHGIYNTTSCKCNCYDFAGSSEPCKHIIRLAMEVGEIDRQFDTDISKVKFPQEATVINKTVYVDQSTGEVTYEKPVPEGPLSGLTIVITGEFDGFSREEISDYISKKGGKVSGSVSKKTSFLLVGTDAGQAKISKASELGIKMISQSDLLAMSEVSLYE